MLNDLIGQTVDFFSRAFLDSAVQYFYIYVLVVIRLAGLMSVAPVFGQSVVPIPIRVMIVLGLGFVLTPMLEQTTGNSIARYDANRDGFLTPDETPSHLAGRIEHLAELNAAKRPQGRADFSIDRVPVSEFASRFQSPETLGALTGSIIAEFSLGFLLGLGVTFLLSGLQLAGQMIDQQLGLEFGAVVNPDLQAGASVSTGLLHLMGTVILLTMQPVNGHVMLLRATLETFDALPVGEAVLFSQTHVLFTELVHKSLLLGVQVAAPVLAAMSIVTVALGFLGHSVPQINQMVVGFPIRSLAGLLIMSVSLSGMGGILVDAVPEAIHDIQAAITSYG